MGKRHIQVNSGLGTGSVSHEPGFKMSRTTVEVPTQCEGDPLYKLAFNIT